MAVVGSLAAEHCLNVRGELDGRTLFRVCS